MTSAGAKEQAANRLETKEAQLVDLLKSLGPVIVAVCGGVDSAYVAVTAAIHLGPRAIAITGDSASYPTFQRELASRIVSKFAIRHELILTEEFEDPDYISNPVNRCYYCKSELYQKMAALDEERGLKVICDGTNADDVGDYRPGRQAAREFGV